MGALKFIAGIGIAAVLGLTAGAGRCAAQLPFRVAAYRPAPGQFVDASLYLSPGQSDTSLTQEQVCDRLNAYMEEMPFSYLVSLGGFGGEITVRLIEPLPNGEGADFKVYGNAFYNSMFMPGISDSVGGSAEPGIVWVSRDENKNGLPDDTWYEIYGSETCNSTTIKDYSITYYEPDSLYSDILWKDNRGETGYIARNSAHSQPNYYPLWSGRDSLCFRGTRLPDNAVWIEREEAAQWILFSFARGYADNHPNNSDLSDIDIDWARDASGNPVRLSEIDFVKVVSGLNQSLPQLGESSTEFAGVAPLHKGLSIEERGKAVRGFCASPNPCGGFVKVYIRMPEPDLVLELFDRFGRCLHRVVPTGDTYIIEMEHFAAGMYFLRYGAETLKILHK